MWLTTDFDLKMQVRSGGFPTVTDFRNQLSYLDLLS